MAWPSLTETLDDFFVHTWYELREKAIDNILLSSAVWAALKMRGSLKPQVGGRFIERTIKYDNTTTLAVAKGDILGQGEPQLETAALWTWRYLSTHIQRSIQDDQVNSGPERIKSLVETRLADAREALVQKFETQILGTLQASEGTKEFQGLHDLLPLEAGNDSGTYGKIARPTTYTANASRNGVVVPTDGNTWWGNVYLPLTTPIAVNLLTNMKTIYNGVANGLAPPNLIVTDQILFEVYEDFAMDVSQIVKDDSTMMADLGFDVLRFKGKPMIWSPNAYDTVNSTSQMMFLNTDYIDIVYDPNLWFDMTEWKAIPLQGERIAHIMCALNCVGSQPRRHGRLYEAT